MAKLHILHDLDNPVLGGHKFEFWGNLLDTVRKDSVTGYAVDVDDKVVRFKNGKQRSADGKWKPV